MRIHVQKTAHIIDRNLQAVPCRAQLGLPTNTFRKPPRVGPAHHVWGCIFQFLLSALVFGSGVQAITRESRMRNLKDAAPNMVGGSPLAAVPKRVGWRPSCARHGTACRFRSINAQFSARGIPHPWGMNRATFLTATVRLPTTGYTAPSDRARLMRDCRGTDALMSVSSQLAFADSLPMQGADAARLRIKVPTPKATPV